MLPEKTTDRTAAKKVAMNMLERAKTMMEVSISGLQHEQTAIANHCAFYAISNAMRACLAYEAKFSRNRDETFQMFRRDFLRSGVFPGDLEPKIAYTLEIHLGLSDEDYYLYTIEQMHTAMDLIRNVQEYLS